jgi:hypothetical protein
MKNQFLLMIFILAGLIHPLKSLADSPAAAPRGIFENDAVLEIEIQSDFPYRSYKGQEAKEEESPELFPEYDGKIYVKGLEGSVPVKLKARGMSKLYLCDFAPVSLKFSKSGDNKIFSGQKKMKLASHCDEGTSIAQGTHPAEDGLKADQYIMKEYLAYKATEILMPEASLKTRLAKIKYTDSKGSVLAHRMAFFLEHKDSFFQRNPSYSEKTSEEISHVIFGADIPATYNKEYFAKQANALNLSNYIQFLLMDRLIVPTDRSLGMFSGNTLTFLDNNQKVMHLHFDFDRSFWVGKFEIYESQRVSELAADLRILCQGSQSGESDFTSEDQLNISLTSEMRFKGCAEAASKIRRGNLDTKLINFVQRFPYLSNSVKQPILDRTVLFFQELAKYQTR